MVYVLILVFIFVDWFSKQFMAAHLDIGRSAAVIPDWLSWKLIHNPGASFGLFSGHSLFLIMIGFIAIFVIGILFLRARSNLRWMPIGLAFVLSGAIGNLIDRVQYGYVIDFIQFRWWPAIFNLADVEIRFGMLMMLVGWILSVRQRRIKG